MSLPSCGTAGLQYSEAIHPVTQPLSPFYILALSDLPVETDSTVANLSGAQHPFLVPLTPTTPL